MDIKQMLYFKTIVDEGTISKAAIKLHMAQPPLSMQLKSLEEELGTGLLIRGRRHVTLTSAGRLFYRRACQMLALEELTLHEMKNVSQQEKLLIIFLPTILISVLLEHPLMD